MKIGVLSDTHDKLANIRRAEDRFAGRGAGAQISVTSTTVPRPSTRDPGGVLDCGMVPFYKEKRDSRSPAELPIIGNERKVL
ncbi:MAG: hypothetical protein NTU62_14445 [Spirochaetes bacterium]|nr:hypothetical protein [Spirochaetota bacterium]